MKTLLLLLVNTPSKWFTCSTFAFGFSYFILTSRSSTDAAVLFRGQRNLLQPVGPSQLVLMPDGNGSNNIVAYNARHPPRNSNRIQSDDSNPAVCEVTRSDGSLHYVVCKQSSSYGDSFCCGRRPAQYCCSSESKNRRKSDNSQSGLIERIGVFAIGLVCSLLFSCCLCLIVCLCIVQPKWRQRTAVGAMQRRTGGSEKSGSSVASQKTLSSMPSRPASPSPPPMQPPRQPQIPLSLQLPPPPPPYSPPAQ
ncbi:hypothetical protein BOX15_Mlig027099g2 [Macrostomum lignano]|uniref:Uncharacterized protein n=1 Tax=Macrostomum lignano TaxID=282301 RepID=A0A267E255_9PLAT|nr:hypothetical protein BOX15_Mlig027099g2 [Macrostomum lignano]